MKIDDYLEPDQLGMPTNSKSLLQMSFPWRERSIIVYMIRIMQRIGYSGPYVVKIAIVPW